MEQLGSWLDSRATVLVMAETDRVIAAAALLLYVVTQAVGKTILQEIITNNLHKVDEWWWRLRPSQKPKRRRSRTFTHPTFRQLAKKSQRAFP